jgi:hypothetical protein
LTFSLKLGRGNLSSYNWNWCLHIGFWCPMSAPEGTSQIIYRLVVWYSPGWQMGWYRECATFTQLQFPHQRQPGNNGCTKGPADLRKAVGAMTHSLVWQLVTNVVGDFEVAQGNWHGGDRSWHFRAPVLMVVQAALTKSQRVVEQCWTCMNMLQPWSYPMILKHYVFDKFDMCNFRINFTVPRDKSRGHPLHKAPRHRNFVQRLHLDPTGLMKARLAVLVPGKSIPWIWIWSLQLRFSSNSAVFFLLLINLYSICWVRLKPHVSNIRRCWDMRGEEVGRGAAFWWFSQQSHQFCKVLLDDCWQVVLWRFLCSQVTGGCFWWGWETTNPP